jgi:hypothetical protein
MAMKLLVTRQSCGVLAALLFFAIAAVTTVKAEDSSSDPQEALNSLIRCDATRGCKSSTCCAVGLCINASIAPPDDACALFNCPVTTVDAICQCGSDGLCHRIATTVPNPVPTSNLPGIPQGPSSPSSKPVTHPSSPVGTFPPQALVCSSSNDCASASCCISTVCINKAFAPNCAVEQANVCPQLTTPCTCTSAGVCAVGSAPNQIRVTNGSTPGGDSNANLLASDANYVAVATTLVTAFTAMVVLTWG